MSNRSDNRCSGRYGLLNTVPSARCRCVFYHGPCPRASAVRPGICVDSCMPRGCRVPWDRDMRCAPICCDKDCLVETTKSAEDCDCCCHRHCGQRPDEDACFDRSDCCQCRRCRRCGCDDDCRDDDCEDDDFEPNLAGIRHRHHTDEIDGGGACGCGGDERS